MGKKGAASVSILQLTPVVFFQVLSNASHCATGVAKSNLGGEMGGRRDRGDVRSPLLIIWPTRLFGRKGRTGKC